MIKKCSVARDFVLVVPAYIHLSVHLAQRQRRFIQAIDIISKLSSEKDITSKLESAKNNASENQTKPFQILLVGSHTIQTVN